MKEVSIERFNASRRSWVEAGKYRFQIQRPTLVDIVKADRGGSTELSIEFAARFVVDWDGITELDLIPGGDPEPIVFDKVVFSAWIADRSDLWKPIAEAIASAYRQHEEQSAERGNV